MINTIHEFDREWAYEREATLKLLRELTDASLAQSVAMATALRGAGVAVEDHVYDGEGHGWRRAATIADDLERVDTFLTRVLLPRLGT